MNEPDDHPAADEIDIGAVFAALADPMRRKVVLLLAGDPPASERLCSSFDLPVTKATRTHHFRVLRQAGLIRQRDLGNGRMNSLRREDLEERFPGLVEIILASHTET